MIPQEWQKEIELLRLHGLTFGRLKEAATVPTSRYRFSDMKFREQPYEGRDTVSFNKEEYTEDVTWPAGTYVVELNQPEAKIAVHLLEPNAPDSFVFWGFFTAIFEQKEYFEEYSMEPLAQKMAAENQALNKEFMVQKLSDTTFAKNQRAMLQFFYKQSPWWDTHKDVYPIGRVFRAEMTIVPEAQYRQKKLLNRR